MICWTSAGILIGTMNVLQWNFNQNSSIYIRENPFENAVWRLLPLCLGLKVFRHYQEWDYGLILYLETLCGTWTDNEPHTGSPWSPNTDI